uniref:G-protein coupled receptors family 1 profile domain-containing protein n=1 Tax=Plectus sambesii TaxID=2011161 RepID=A0A914WXE6_9BILA
MVWYSNALEVFVLATVPIYVSVLLVLWLNRRDSILGSPFFVVFMAAGLSDIFVAVQRACCIQAPTMFFYEVALNSRAMATICLATRRHAGTTQCLGTVLLALNRFTAVVFPLRHKLV